MQRAAIGIVIIAVSAAFLAADTWTRSGRISSEEFSGRAEPTEAMGSAAGPERCRTTGGEDRVYAVELGTRYRLSVPEFGAGSPPVSGSTHWEGRLEVDVRSDDDDDPSWVVALRDVKTRSGDPAQQELLARLQIPAVVRFDASCRVLEWAFEEGTEPAVQDQWKLLLSLFELAIPPDAVGQDQWEVAQVDPTGEALVEYSRLDGMTILRRKLSYRRLALQVPGVRHEARIREAEALFRLREDDGSVESLSGVEDVAIFADDGVRPFAEASTSFSLRRVRVPERPRLATPARPQVSPGQALARPGAEHFDPYPGTLPSEFGEARLLYEQQLADLGLRAALGVLVPYLRAHPEAAQELLATLREGGLSQDGQRLAYLALELAGTREAREALAQGLTDPSFQVRDRIRAAAALPDVAEVGEVVDALRQATRDPDLEVAHASLLGMGRAARRPDLPPEVRAGLVDELSQSLGASSSPGERIVAMEALANTQDPAAASVIDRYLESDDPLERAAAVESLGRIGVPPPADRTAALLERETSPRAQRAMAELLAARAELAAPETVDSVVRKLLSGAPLPASVAKPLVTFLGAQADNDPEAARALEQVMGAYSDRDVRRMAARFVAPSP